MWFSLVVCDDLKKLVLTLENRVGSLEKGGKSSAPAPAAADDDDDDDVDLFGSDSDEEEDAEKVRVREERLKAYHEKKAKKPALIAKTSVLLDVKPWDDETDMDAMLAACKTIEKEGLVWGACKLLLVCSAFGHFGYCCSFFLQPSWSPSVTASRSCRSCAWWRTRRSPSTSFASRSRSSRTTSSPSTLLP